jgi:hypothetical protein
MDLTFTEYQFDQATEEADEQRSLLEDGPGESDS